MTPYKDFESMLFIEQKRSSMLQSYIREAYRGISIVGWYGNIERQLVSMLDEFEDNSLYSDKIQTFLNTWRNNPITGSINVEDVETLEAAAAQLAVDSWKLQSYFSALRDRLRQLQAGEEELPRGDEQAMSGKKPSISSMSNFGGKEEAPPEPAPAQQPQSTPQEAPLK